MKISYRITPLLILLQQVGSSLHFHVHVQSFDYTLPNALNVCICVWMVLLLIKLHSFEGINEPAFQSMRELGISEWKKKQFQKRKRKEGDRRSTFTPFLWRVREHELYIRIILSASHNHGNLLMFYNQNLSICWVVILDKKLYESKGIGTYSSYHIIETHIQPSMPINFEASKKIEWFCEL